MINHNTDELDQMGFISKDYILDRVSQEEIFALVFGYEPVEYQFVVSPFRVDMSPGCYFEYYNDTLRFKDFGDPRTYGHVKLRNMDCFDAVYVFFKLANFFETLSFIEAKLINLEGFKKREVREKKSYSRTTTKGKDTPTQFFVATRGWENRDKAFWGKYGISKSNLQEDKVFPINRFKVKGSKRGTFNFTVTGKGYVFTNFESGAKKVYRPYEGKNLRFMTNCTNDDIGELNKLVPFGRQLIISKSYKDCRVLRNLNLNTVWFQNEGQTPNDKLLHSLAQRFDRILVFFDNDDTGIRASKDVSDKINSLFTQNKSTFLYLPEDLIKYQVSDPADLIHRRGKKHLTSFLNEKKLLLL